MKEKFHAQPPIICTITGRHLGFTSTCRKYIIYPNFFCRKTFHHTISKFSASAFSCLFRIGREFGFHCKNDPELRKIYFPELFRTSRLLSDLNLFFGEEDWKNLPILQSTQEYVDRIRLLNNQKNYAIVAHHYTRYLGDLSGGQAMKRIVLNMFPEDFHSGISFYEFPEILNFNRF